MSNTISNQKPPHLKGGYKKAPPTRCVRAVNWEIMKTEMENLV